MDNFWSPNKGFTYGTKREAKEEEEEEEEEEIKQKGMETELKYGNYGF